MKKPILQRIMGHVRKDPGSGCWVWTASKVNGYGYMNVTKGKKMRVHRVMYELSSGAIPEGMVVRHRCDNPPCVNPEHLEVGTQTENMADMEVRGRRAKGKRRCVSVRIAEAVGRALERERAATMRAIGYAMGRVRRERSKRKALSKAWKKRYGALARKYREKLRLSRKRSGLRRSAEHEAQLVAWLRRGYRNGIARRTYYCAKSGHGCGEEWLSKLWLKNVVRDEPALRRSPLDDPKVRTWALLKMAEWSRNEDEQEEARYRREVLISEVWKGIASGAIPMPGALEAAFTRRRPSATAEVPA